MKRGEVLFIAPSAYTLGGIQTWLDYVLPGLLDHGWRITLGLTGGRFHDVDEYLKVHRFERHCRIEARTGTREGRVQSLMAAISRVKPDIVVNLNIVDTYEAVARVSRGTAGPVKVVATLHGQQPDFLNDFKRLKNNLDGIVCTNRLTCELVSDYSGIPSERIMYAPYGVAVPDAFPDRRVDARRPLRVAYAGRLEQFQKRVKDVLDIIGHALSQGLDIELFVAGDGPEKASFFEQAEQAGCAEKIRYLGVLSPEKLRERLYQACDALIITSRWETGPIVAWEAMSAGMALVTSDYLGRKKEGSLRDKENCLVFPVGDIKPAVACLKLMGNLEFRKKLAFAGWHMVRNRYSRMRSVEQLSRCLDDVLALPPIHRDMHVFEHPRVTSRLEKAIGKSGAERVRRLLGREFLHSGPGGEWPHSYGGTSPDDPEFWDRACKLDVVAPAG